MTRSETEPIDATATRGYLTTSEVAKRLNKSPQCVNDWINNGRRINGKTVLLKSVRIVGERRIRPEDLTEFLAHWN